MTTDVQDRGFTLKQAQESFGPILLGLGQALIVLEPICDQIASTSRTVWAALEPYHPEDLLSCVYGLLLVYFGGVYLTIIAAIEAVNIFGWGKIRVALHELHRNYVQARYAWEHDDKKDEDRDGVADVKNLTPQQLAARKVLVITRAINPDTCSAALEGLTEAFIAVIATLKVEFAKSITLGTAIGEVLYKFLGFFLIQSLDAAFPREYEKWSPVLARYGCRYVGISFAWWVQRMISAVFSGMRGSSIFFSGLVGYLVRYGYLERGNTIFKQGNPLMVGAWAALALMGIWWQLSSNFKLPFPLNILLLPLSILERVLMFFVAVKD